MDDQVINSHSMSDFEPPFDLATLPGHMMSYVLCLILRDLARARGEHRRYDLDAVKGFALFLAHNVGLDEAALTSLHTAA